LNPENWDSLYIVHSLSTILKVEFLTSSRTAWNLRYIEIKKEASSHDDFISPLMRTVSLLDLTLPSYHRKGLLVSHHHLSSNLLTPTYHVRANKTLSTLS
jgi:hypothetical protein